MTYSSMIRAGEEIQRERGQRQAKETCDLMEELEKRNGGPLTLQQQEMAQTYMDKKHSKENLLNIAMAASVAALPFTITVAGPVLGVLAAVKVGRACFGVGRALEERDITELAKAGLFGSAAGVEIMHGLNK